jgi:hypothetical protein
MGQSTDAIIAFGLNYGEDSEKFPWSQNEQEFNDWWAEQNGVTTPPVEFQGNETLYRTFWANQREVEKTCPVEVITHCHYDNPMFFIAIRGTELRASRGCPENLPLDLASNVDTYTQQLLNFLRKYNIELPEEDPTPKWQLFSDWS